MNVKMLKWVLPMLALPALVTSCSQDDDPDYHGGEYVSINSVGVGVLQTKSGYDATDNFMPDNGTLKLLLTSSGEDPQYSSNGTDFTPNGGVWYTENPLVWAANSTADWSAFFTSRNDDGYSNNADTKELTWSIPTDQSSLLDDEMNGLDLLYAYGNTSSSAIDVAFSHLMAKIQLNFIDKTNYFSGKQITDVKIEFLDGSGTPKSIGFSYILPISIGKRLYAMLEKNTQLENASEMTLHKIATKNIDNCIASFDGILIPQATGSAYNIYIYCDNSNEYCYKTKVYPQLAGNIFFGTCHEFNLIVGGDYFIVDSATVNTWTEVDAGKLETE